MWPGDPAGNAGTVSRPWFCGSCGSPAKKGDEVTVEGYGANDGSDVANARTVTMPDGRKLFGGFQTTPGAPVK